MATKQVDFSRSIPAIRVTQWLHEWGSIDFDEASHRRRPAPYFYLFALSGPELKALSGIQRRTTQDGLRRTRDLGIQRRHDPERSAEIREFIKYGYPWSDLSPAKRNSGEFEGLRKPGWLPTAIVVNILQPGDIRRGLPALGDELMSISGDADNFYIRLPKTFTSLHWTPERHHPLEIIDGQHRLWAFDSSNVHGDYQLPVVAFYGLDLSWQAYLFWSINIKPKRINASLAFDLYPLLRTEEWLTRFDGHSIYRETRAQELTEALWSSPQSPWFHRINMLGELGQKSVTQAAWIRSLLATYVKAWESNRAKIGGLFGAPVGKSKEALPWSRAQQAAFLILVWQSVYTALKSLNPPWAISLRRGLLSIGEQWEDPAFSGPHTLLNTDQGVRGVLFVSNDLSYLAADTCELFSWSFEQSTDEAGEAAITEALQSIESHPVASFIQALAEDLIAWDWRSSSADELTEPQKTAKLVFRGSGGYRELRRQLLLHLVTTSADEGVRKTASLAFDMLGFNR